jgi:hypothetical protein
LAQEGEECKIKHTINSSFEKKKQPKNKKKQKTKKKTTHTHTNKNKEKKNQPNPPEKHVYLIARAGGIERRTEDHGW